jgi:transposase-like protein
MVPGTVETRPPPGFVVHKSRHLCRRCFAHARHFGQLDQYPRVYRRAAEVIEDAAFLAEQGLKRMEIITKLGMSRSAFERTHQRAGVRMPR